MILYKKRQKKSDAIFWVEWPIAQDGTGFKERQSKLLERHYQPQAVLFQ